VYTKILASRRRSHASEEHDAGSPLEQQRGAVPPPGSFGTMVLERLYASLPSALDWRERPQPLAAWRRAPEKELRALDLEQRLAFLRTLLPLMRIKKTVSLPALRRLYQLFSMMDIPGDRRREIVSALYVSLRLDAGEPPSLPNEATRRSLVDEAIILAGGRPRGTAKDYLETLRQRLGIPKEEVVRWEQLFDKLTTVENRFAKLLGKKGHLVKLDDRKVEILKKAIAYAGIPLSVLYPLGEVGLLAETAVTSGLAVIGGGYVLTGAVVLIAIGGTSKKLLDMLWPTTDADKASIVISELQQNLDEIRLTLDEAGSPEADPSTLERARNKIAEIIRKIVPPAEREWYERLQVLGRRYLEYLQEDEASLLSANHVAGGEVSRLRELDQPVIRP
jgi:hypothetical protein